MTERDGQLTKRVDFVAKDDAEQVATGIVMVPDKVDRQGDFAREETIREFAEQFENFVDAGEAGGGIMHAVWPSDWMSLERNEVLDEDTEIGGSTAPAGAWVQDWKFEKDELWSLVTDGILQGNSIGAVNVQWDGPYEQEELPDDVEVAEDYPDDELVWELVSGLVREVSSVDIPAVPDALVLETKADAEKRLGDYLGNRDGFLEEAQQRGHSESEAERLWEVLNTAADIEGAGEPGEKSLYQRIGKAVVEAIPGAGGARPTSSPTKTASDEPDESPDEQHDKNAAGGDTPDEGGSTTEAADDMSNTNDDSESEEKDLAEKNAEQISELTEAVEDLTETIAGPEAKTAEIEIGGETYEVQEDAAKAALGVDEETTVADAIKQLEDQVELANDRIEAINRQHGGSGQVDAAAAAEADNDNDESALSEIGKALS